MHEILNRNAFLVKEHVGIFKAANNYDIYDPHSGEILLECREKNLGFWKFLRFTDYKTVTPFDIHISTPDGVDLISVKRGWSFWRSRVTVYDGKGQSVGRFRQRMLSIGGRFDVLGPDENDDTVLCELKGKWTSWEFKFIAGDKEFAQVTKQWAGAAKEIFTSADNYVLEISESVPEDNRLRQLILAAVMCIDMVLKERN